MRPGPVQYTTVGDEMVAYQVTGSGPIDIVYMIGAGTNFDMWWDYRPFAGVLERFATYGRLILFDRRGSGISDPLPPDRLPTWEHYTEDLHAVLDAAGSERVAIIACFDSGPMALAYAAARPERVRALALWNSYALHGWASDYEIGVRPEVEEAANRAVRDLWGTEELGRLLLTEAAEDEAAVRWLARVLRHAATPTSFARQQAQLVAMDARPFLALIRAPVLALNTSHVMIPPEMGRYVADHVANGRFVEVPGASQEIFSASNRDEIEDLLQEFITGARPTPRTDRVLASVLFTDIVASTATAARLGDAKWKVILDAHDRASREVISRWDGQFIKSTGDGILATFDGPGRALRAGIELHQAVAGLGIAIRAGVHFGEVERRADGDIGGLGVHVAARVMSHANDGGIACTRTVKELSLGSDLRFAEAGVHELTGVPDQWALYFVEAS